MINTESDTCKILKVYLLFNVNNISILLFMCIIFFLFALEFKFIFMKYIKKPIRGCFTKYDVRPKSFKLEQFINADSRIDAQLKELGISVPIGSSLYLLYCGDNDYIVFTSYYSVEDFIKCNL